MPTSPPSITALPAAPDPSNRSTFNSLAYPWSAALPTFGTEVSAVAANVKANADEAQADAVATAADAVATAADREQTWLDRAAVAADKVIVQEIATTAGVASVNGLTGVVTGIATTGANTFTAAQESPTGAAIASAATVNLNTATGNRVHITGTTTITSVSLTRGPRTVIFDGILTLTHHTTNNNLPGAANITTSAGDRAIYESDGTTVYCIAYTRKDGTGLVAASIGNHAVTVHAGNGHGSTNTMIRRFTTTLTSVGDAITYADSATLGASFTVNSDGIYAMTYWDEAPGAAATLGISVGSSEVTTTVTNIAVATALGHMRTSSGSIGIVSRTARLTAGDVIRPHTDGSFTATSSSRTYFAIRKIGS